MLEGRASTVTRRTVLAAAGSLALAGLVKGTKAQSDISSGSKLFFPPGCRIGIEKPDEIDFISSIRNSRSSDHTFGVQIFERLRVPDRDDFYRWRGREWEFVEPNVSVPNIETWRVWSKLYGEDPDYSLQSLILLDAQWIGELRIETNAVGLLAGGMRKRWWHTSERLIASVRVRPSPPLVQVLTEHALSIDTTGFHGLFDRHEIHLSLDGPLTPTEIQSGSGNARNIIQTHGLPFSPRLTTDEDIGDLLASRRQSDVFERWDRKGVEWLLNRPVNTRPASSFVDLEGYGHGRRIELRAIYEEPRKAEVMAALRRLADSVVFLD